MHLADLHWQHFQGQRIWDSQHRNFTTFPASALGWLHVPIISSSLSEKTGAASANQTSQKKKFKTYLMSLKTVNVSLALNDEGWIPCLALGTSGHRHPEGRMEKVLCLQLLAPGIFSPLPLINMQKVTGQVMEYPIFPLLSSSGGFGCTGEGSGGSGCPLLHIPALSATATSHVLLPWALVRMI